MLRLAVLLLLHLSSVNITHHCSWPGITCDRFRHVIALNFSSRGLTGPIPHQIWELRHLQVLDLRNNRFDGTLPFRFPTQLQVLNLSQNRLRGNIPGSLFGSLPNLRELDFSGNLFTGSIPGSGFCGNNLKHLDFSGNLLTGGIPASLGNCTRLENLMLFSNRLEGIVPSELGRLRKLRVLDVSRNSLSGFVPKELGGCLELSVLVLSNLIGSSVGMDEFNRFRGRLPESTAALPKLRVLWAPGAMLGGNLPCNWGNCDNLEIVNLGRNLFTGQIPEAFDGCRNIKYLNLSSNELIGQLSKELPVPCMDVFDVSNNHLSGSIPLFTTDKCSSLLLSNEEDISSNYASFFVSKTRSGVSLPLFADGDLFTVYHSFGMNNFSGMLRTLPVATKKYGDKTIYAFLADGNNIMGSLDASFFEKCESLNGLIVDLSNNRLSGDIASEIGGRCRSLLVLHLSHNNISGKIPSSLGLLGRLVKLDLSWNFLNGRIPESFEQFKSTEYLSLGNNNLSGKIPSGLGRLRALKFLDLSSNSLTGEIPHEVMNLSNLCVLLLNNNKLCGNISSSTTAHVTSFSMFNVSSNNLSGPLPLNARIMACSSFQGNPPTSLSFRRASLLANSQSPEADTSSSPANSTSNNGSNGFSSIEIASITSACSIVAVLLALVVLYIYTRKCAPRSSVRSAERKEVTVVVDIGVPLTYEIVAQATRGFNASNCIGSGGFGATYKAEIAPGVIVAIKKLAIGRFQGAQQFQAEIKTLGRWHHPNLVTLIGHHISDSEMFLIYNYLPGGNLERFIQERYKRPVDWRMLHKIALDVARALAYLHEQNPRILHRDVKPSNILLDNEFNAYLSDFGLARLMGNSETHATTGVAGTFGYVAPEYAMTCRVSDKADVYSYGVVLLELISDKKALDPSFSPYGNGFNIVTWASMMLHRGRAREFFAEGLWDVAPHDDLVEILDIGIKCTVDSLSVRPTMKEVVRQLKDLHPPPC